MCLVGRFSKNLVNTASQDRGAMTTMMILHTVKNKSKPEKKACFSFFKYFVVCCCPENLCKFYFLSRNFPPTPYNFLKFSPMCFYFYKLRTGIGLSKALFLIFIIILIILSFIITLTKATSNHRQG